MFHITDTSSNSETFLDFYWSYLQLLWEQRWAWVHFTPFFNQPQNSISRGSDVVSIGGFNSHFFAELRQSQRRQASGLLSQQIQRFSRCCRRTRSLTSLLDSPLHSGCFRRFLRRVRSQIFFLPIEAVEPQTVCCVFRLFSSLFFLFCVGCL